MTWAAWRVQRPQLLAAIGAVLMLGLWLAATALAMGHDQAWKYWTDGDVYVLYALPGLVGLALGVPLVAGEFGHGTNRLAWTQSVTRVRWLAVKLAVGGLVAAGIVAALAVLLEWWTRAISLAASTDSGGFAGVRIQPSGFDLAGIVIIGYAVFAFALGAALGAIVRRAGWAFAVGVPVFAACRLVVEDWIRPHLVAAGDLRQPDRGSFASRLDRLGPELWPAAGRPDQPGTWTGLVGGAACGLQLLCRPGHRRTAGWPTARSRLTSATSSSSSRTATTGRSRAPRRPSSPSWRPR